MELLFKNFTHLNNDEHQKLLNIRNSNHVRMQMKNDRHILLKEHIKWVKNLQNDETNFYHACFMDKKIIGCIDITNIKNDAAFWGFYFEKETSPLVVCLCVYALIERIFYQLNLQKIISEVKKTNTNAYDFNRSFGFLHVRENEEYNFLELTKDNWEKQNLQAIKKKLLKTDYTFI